MFVKKKKKFFKYVVRIMSKWLLISLCFSEATGKSVLLSILDLKYLNTHHVRLNCLSSHSQCLDLLDTCML